MVVRRRETGRGEGSPRTEVLGLGRVCGVDDLAPTVGLSVVNSAAGSRERVSTASPGEIETGPFGELPGDSPILPETRTIGETGRETVVCLDRSRRLKRSYRVVRRCDECF